MTKKQPVALRCACERAHVFEAAFAVREGAGSTTVELYCPNPSCPLKGRLQAFTIPHLLQADESPLKGPKDSPKLP